MKVAFLFCHVSTCVAQLPPSVIVTTTTVKTAPTTTTSTTVKAEPTTTTATTTVKAAPTTTRQRSRFGNDIPKDAGCMSAEDQAELCREQYVDPKDCAKWVGPCNKFHYEIPKNAGCMSAEDQAELCRENYVDPKDCAKWVGPCNNASSAILVMAERQRRFGYDIPKDAGCMSAEDQAELCREQYADPEDCAKWIGPCHQEHHRKELPQPSGGPSFDHQVPKHAGCLSAEEQAELCREQYVDPEDCADWVGPCNKFNYTIPEHAGCLSARDQAELCRENYVDQEGCAKWVGPCDNFLAELPQGLPALLLAAGGAGVLAAVAVSLRRERRVGPSEPLLPSDVLL